MKTVTLHGAKAAGRVALVDDEDYPLVMQYRWHVYEEHRNGRRHGPYAVSTSRDVGGTPVTTRMHCLVLGVKGVDHMDHDGLNNQRSNLRPATSAQNSRNRRPHVGTTSQYKGVHWSKNAGKWQALIQGKNKRHLGLFTSEEDAALAYNAAALKDFGEFAFLNQVDAA